MKKKITPKGFITLDYNNGSLTRLYQTYIPSFYEEEEKWPLILFLHGAGEGGADGLLQTEYQLGSAIRRHPERYPCIVLFPQVQNKGGWSNDDLLFAVETINIIKEIYNIDDDRIYLTGVSSGGKGAWSLLNSHYKLFSAALIVCGRLLPQKRNGVRKKEENQIAHDCNSNEFLRLAENLSDLPLWIFHGTDDPIFEISDTRLIVSNLAKNKVPVIYTELNNFGHDVWDVAYYSNEVIAWLLSISKNKCQKESSIN